MVKKYVYDWLYGNNAKIILNPMNDWCLCKIADDVYEYHDELRQLYNHHTKSINRS
jgi:hypothetical protein